MQAVPRARRRRSSVQQQRRDGAAYRRGGRRGRRRARLLAEHGADLDVQDKSGRTPLDIAMGKPPTGFVGRRGAAPGQARESTAALLKELAARSRRARPSKENNDACRTETWVTAAVRCW